MATKCGDCKWWRRNDKEIQPVGFCVKNPPVPVIIHTQQGAAQQSILPITHEASEFGCFVPGNAPNIALSS